MANAKNSQQVGIFYDANGLVVKYVYADNDDFSKHQDKNLIFVTVPKATFDTLPPALNIAGLANPYDLNQLTAPLVSAIDPKVGSKIQSSVDQVTLSLAVQPVDIIV